MNDILNFFKKVLTKSNFFKVMKMRKSIGRHSRLLRTFSAAKMWMRNLLPTLTQDKASFNLDSMLICLSKVSTSDVMKVGLLAICRPTENTGNQRKEVLLATEQDST